uniref:Uncharacterized protein n=1 Tax=Anguilla anguilla TaxID=7936 RepID=A0A0E9VPA3_ANGAN
MLLKSALETRFYLVTTGTTKTRHGKNNMIRYPPVNVKNRFRDEQVDIFLKPPGCSKPIFSYKLNPVPVRDFLRLPTEDELK